VLMIFVVCPQLTCTQLKKKTSFRHCN